MNRKSQDIHSCLFNSMVVCFMILIHSNYTHLHMWVKWLLDHLVELEMEEVVQRMDFRVGRPGSNLGCMEN